MNDVIKQIDGEWTLTVLPGERLTSSQYITDLLNQLKGDIFPVLPNAPFTVARNIFCFIDHVSVLRYGKTKIKGEQTNRIKKLIGNFAKFDEYINDKYKLYSSYIVQIYRHDLVHNIRPLQHRIKVISEKGEESSEESWFVISSQLPYLATEDYYSLKKFFKNTSNRKNLCHLRYSGNQIVVNNYCLFFDLVNYLEDLIDEIKTKSELREKFAKNYEKVTFQHIDIFDFTLDKRIDKEC